MTAYGANLIVSLDDASFIYLSSFSLLASASRDGKHNSKSVDRMMDGEERESDELFTTYFNDFPKHSNGKIKFGILVEISLPADM